MADARLATSWSRVLLLLLAAALLRPTAGRSPARWQGGDGAPGGPLLLDAVGDSSVLVDLLPHGDTTQGPLKRSFFEKHLRVRRRYPHGEQALEAKWALFTWVGGLLVIVAVVLGALCSFLPSRPTAELEVLAPRLDSEEEPPSRLPMVMMTAAWCTLAFMPLGLASRLFDAHVAVTFWVNLLAIVPESVLIGIATEELAVHLGDAAGALLNASFGNAVEIVFAAFSLKAGLLDACAGNLVGSILANQLGLLGCVFLAAGVWITPPFTLRLGREASFDVSSALNQAQMLLLSSFSVTLPATYAQLQHVTPQHLLALSQALGFLLVLCYVAFVAHLLHSRGPTPKEEQHARLGIRTGMALLALATVLLAASTECMVASLGEFCRRNGLSQMFVGVVLMPVAGDFSHISAIYFAMKGKMDLAISIALASAIGNALLVMPGSLLLGHLFNQPMTLAFHPVHGVTLIISAIITLAVLVEGRSNWLRGVTLLATFAFVSVMVFFMPEGSEHGLLSRT
mmetsp:Transcript_87445/g.187579  ORF Transcript_87445/g.187579 Transcript_87445/m.187579 type:complete len:512 (-) Transcript_87445:54-1589(-)